MDVAMPKKSLFAQTGCGLDGCSLPAFDLETFLSIPAVDEDKLLSGERAVSAEM